MFNFFKNKAQEPKKPITLANIEADWHCHVLPQIDDGSSSEAETLAMLRRYKLLNINKIIATPHIRSDFYRNTKETISEAYHKTQKLIVDNNIGIDLEYSAEYYADENFLELLKNNDLLPIENQYILFELPMNQMPIFGSNLIEKIQRLGYSPLLAHPERYRFWQDKKQQIKAWKQAGVYFQLNLLSLVGHYGSAERKLAEWLIECDYIDAVGTDAHGMRHLESLAKLTANPFFEQLEQMPLLNKDMGQ